MENVLQELTERLNAANAENAELRALVEAAVEDLKFMSDKMERGKFEWHSNQKDIDIDVWTITHWMPIPQPPKGE